MEYKPGHIPSTILNTGNAYLFSSIVDTQSCLVSGVQLSSLTNLSIMLCSSQV